MTHSQEHFTKQAVPISCKENALFVKCIFYLAANHIIVHCCHVKAVCLHADHAHQTLPSPTTGTIRRHDACGVIIDGLQKVKHIQFLHGSVSQTVNTLGSSGGHPP